jgi:hypothetical protein
MVDGRSACEAVGPDVAFKGSPDLARWLLGLAHVAVETEGQAHHALTGVAHMCFFAAPKSRRGC